MSKFLRWYGRVLALISLQVPDAQAHVLRRNATVAATRDTVALTCPGIPSLTRAFAQVTVEAHASCERVRSEMLARVSSQPQKWHDPHNNGKYTHDGGKDPAVLRLTRLTGDHRYTDAMELRLEDKKGAGRCAVQGCSESQVLSLLDFSTNYCNLRMLYCGKKEGCHPVENDFPIVETQGLHSFGAGLDPGACLKK
mmetsp:Transcript_60476/g.170387  ORF Transcript_60476/g.170387 Transcript_60476/m.170387 type:complete len:196 (+) Transcript_60476:89-676(+)